MARGQKETERVKEEALARARERFPDAEDIRPQVDGTSLSVHVLRNGQYELHDVGVTVPWAKEQRRRG